MEAVGHLYIALYRCEWTPSLNYFFLWRIFITVDTCTYQYMWQRRVTGDTFRLFAAYVGNTSFGGFRRFV